jgi:hypothetical protein
MIQRIALVFGIAFIAVGILGFLASGMDMTADPETAPRVLGLFPVNAVHNGVHIGLGIWGLLASRSWAGAKNFATIGGAIYLFLTALAFVSPDGFGLVPLGGNDILLHGVAGAAMLLAGMTAKAPAPR